MMENLLRYLTKQKFEWLLEDQGLYVSSAADQSDKLEGIYDHTYMSKALKGSPELHFYKNDMWKNLDDTSQSLMHASRESSYISSWYYGDDEQEAMWEEYSSDGVVIMTSTMGLLLNLPEPLKQTTQFFKAVYNNQEKYQSHKDALKFKNVDFSNENEYRLIFDVSKYSLLTGFEKEIHGEAYIGDKPSYESDITSCMSEEALQQSLNVLSKKNNGYILKYDLGKVIKEIRFNPKYSTYSKNELEELCKNSDVKIPVVESTLSRGKK